MICHVIEYYSHSSHNMKIFEFFLFGFELTSMSPWKSNNKIRNAMNLQLTNLKTLNLLLVL